MGKQIQAKNLNDSKVSDFIGIQDNIDPLSERRSVVKCTNLEPHVEPGMFILREPYQLKYKKPTDLVYQRNNTEEFVSFDNFYEKTARDQAEVTVLVSKAEIQAPLINGSRITSYTFRSVNIYIRPHWTGSYWNNSWMWLNEPFITKITVDIDATIKNKIQVSGYFGNMLQWTLINVTKDKTLPHAIIRSAENGSNTDLWLSVYDPDFDVDDEIVLMRNYIPLKYLVQNYNVIREEISFHRVLSKMRIGFGGKEGRIALGIGYQKRILKMADYSFTNTDPVLVGNELLFADVNRMIVQPYIGFNENKREYNLSISLIAGTLTEQTIYFRMTAVYDSIDEFLVVEKSIHINTNQSIVVYPQIHAGSLSRRLTEIKIYISQNGLDYYFWQEYQVAVAGNGISGKDWTLNEDGYFSFNVNLTALTDLNTESNATSAADSNAKGSWLGNNVSVVAATNFAIQTAYSGGYYAKKGELFYPIERLAAPLTPGRTYRFTIKHKAWSVSGAQTYLGGILLFRWYGSSTFFGYPNPGLPNPLGDIMKIIELESNIPLTTSFVETIIDIEIPAEITDDLSDYFLCFYGTGNISTYNGDTYQIESLTIVEQDTLVFDDFDVLDAEMNAEMGYQPTFNLVKDWQNATYLNGRTYVAPAFIEKRYDTFVFGSQVNGLGANMHDVIPAGATVFAVDEFRGEVITGMIVMHNLNIAVFTDGGLIILDPDTGNTREVARGFGLRVKGSIVVFRGSIIYGSDEDFIQISASTGYNATPLSTKSVRKIYNNLPDKNVLSACFDKFGTYRVACGETAEYRELVLTDRGWINQDRLHYPQVLRNGLGGRVWFLNEGDIYAMPYDEAEFVGFADIYGDYRSGW